MLLELRPVFQPESPVALESQSANLLLPARSSTRSTVAYIVARWPKSANPVDHCQRRDDDGGCAPSRGGRSQRACRLLSKHSRTFASAAVAQQLRSGRGQWACCLSCWGGIHPSASGRVSGREAGVGYRHAASGVHHSVAGAGSLALVLTLVRLVLLSGRAGDRPRRSGNSGAGGRSAAHAGPQRP